MKYTLTNEDYLELSDFVRESHDVIKKIMDESTHFVSDRLYTANYRYLINESFTIIKQANASINDYVHNFDKRRLSKESLIQQQSQILDFGQETDLQINNLLDDIHMILSIYNLDIPSNQNAEAEVDISLSTVKMIVENYKVESQRLVSEANEITLGIERKTEDNGFYQFIFSELSHLFNFYINLLKVMTDKFNKLYDVIDKMQAKAIGQAFVSTTDSSTSENNGNRLKRDKVTVPKADNATQAKESDENQQEMNQVDELSDDFTTIDDDRFMQLLVFNGLNSNEINKLKKKSFRYKNTSMAGYELDKDKPTGLEMSQKFNNILFKVQYKELMNKDEFGTPTETSLYDILKRMVNLETSEDHGDNNFVYIETAKKELKKKLLQGKLRSYADLGPIEVFFNNIDGNDYNHHTAHAEAELVDVMGAFIFKDFVEMKYCQEFYKKELNYIPQPVDLVSNDYTWQDVHDKYWSTLESTSSDNTTFKILTSYLEKAEESILSSGKLNGNKAIFRNNKKVHEYIEKEYTIIINSLSIEIDEDVQKIEKVLKSNKSYIHEMGHLIAALGTEELKFDLLTAGKWQIRAIGNELCIKETKSLGAICICSSKDGKDNSNLTQAYLKFCRGSIISYPLYVKAGLRIEEFSFVKSGIFKKDSEFEEKLLNNDFASVLKEINASLEKQSI